MTDWQEVRVGDLNVVARPLAEAAEGFSDLAGSAPQAPNAGPSTANVGDFLVALANAMTRISQTAAGMGDTVQADGQRYRDTEQQNTQQIRAVDPQCPVPPQAGGR